MAFCSSQEQLRQIVLQFFDDDKNYERLNTLLSLSPDICLRVLFFVSKFGATKIYNIDGYPQSPGEMYKATLRSYRKRFFDFESTEGKGDIILDGVVNPKIQVCPARGDISLVLPVAVAMRWFLKKQLDVPFVQDLDNINASFDAYNHERRHRYSQRHKCKRKILRTTIEHKVHEESLLNKSSEEKDKRKCWLTQEERRRVNELIGLEIKTQKQKKRVYKKIKRFRGNKAKPTIEIAASFNQITPL